MSALEGAHSTLSYEDIHHIADGLHPDSRARWYATLSDPSQGHIGWDLSQDDIVWHALSILIQFDIAYRLDTWGPATQPSGPTPNLSTPADLHIDYTEVRHVFRLAGILASSRGVWGVKWAQTQSPECDTHAQHIADLLNPAEEEGNSVGSTSHIHKMSQTMVPGFTWDNWVSQVRRDRRKFATSIVAMSGVNRDVAEAEIEKWLCTPPGGQPHTPPPPRQSQRSFGTPAPDTSVKGPRLGTAYENKSLRQCGVKVSDITTAGLAHILEGCHDPHIRDSYESIRIPREIWQRVLPRYGVAHMLPTQGECTTQQMWEHIISLDIDTETPEHMSMLAAAMQDGDWEDLIVPPEARSLNAEPTVRAYFHNASRYLMQQTPSQVAGATPRDRGSSSISKSRNWGTTAEGTSPKSTHKPPNSPYSGSPRNSSGHKGGGDSGVGGPPRVGVGGTPKCPQGVHHKSLIQIEKIVCKETLDRYKPLNERLLEFLDICDTRCLTQAESPAQRMWAILTHTHSMLESGKITQPKDVVHVRHTLRVWAGAIALDLEKNRWIDDGSTADGTSWEEVRGKLSAMKPGGLTWEDKTEARLRELHWDTNTCPWEFFEEWSRAIVPFRLDVKQSCLKLREKIPASWQYAIDKEIRNSRESGKATDELVELQEAVAATYLSRQGGATANSKGVPQVASLQVEDIVAAFSQYQGHSAPDPMCPYCKREGKAYKHSSKHCWDPNNPEAGLPFCLRYMWACPTLLSCACKYGTASERFDAAALKEETTSSANGVKAGPLTDSKHLTRLLKEHGHLEACGCDVSDGDTWKKWTLLRDCRAFKQFKTILRTIADLPPAVMAEMDADLAELGGAPIDHM